MDKPLLSLMTLKKVLTMLPEGQFLRIHRSYIVPVAGIRAIAHKKVRLENIELPIGDTYADQLKNLTS
ncbi:LytTr DNA-binding domain protein [compost metagenome]